MRLGQGIDLGYCTNIHRGETWEETFRALRQHTDAVRRKVSPDRPYGIGLRLGAEAAGELEVSAEQRAKFRRWMEDHDSYLFTINGFPYGAFHGTRVKEQVYAPDWTRPERLDYTRRLFDLAVELAPGGREVSVSTLPGSFKEFIRPETRDDQLAAIRKHLLRCSEHIEELRERTGREIHLGLEPEPLGLFETSGETVAFFGEMVDGLGAAERERFLRNVGVNYDTCHLAVEYEEPAGALGRIRNAGIRISKIHLSSALRLAPGVEALERLRAFDDEVYLHQVVVRRGEEVAERIRDLPEAFAWAEERLAEAGDAGDAGGHSSASEVGNETAAALGDEWRVHFHVPLHARPDAPFADTRDHVTGVLALLAENPGWCRHFEMETYTWEVLPDSLRSQDVVDQLVAEYRWCLEEFGRAGLRE